MEPGAPMLISCEELWRRRKARAEGVRPFLATCSKNLQGAVSQSAGSPQALGLQRIVRQALWQADSFREQVQQDIALLNTICAGGYEEVAELHAGLHEEADEAQALCSAFSDIKESLCNSHAAARQSPKEMDTYSVPNLAATQAPQGTLTEDVSSNVKGTEEDTDVKALIVKNEEHQTENQVQAESGHAASLEGGSHVEGVDVMATVDSPGGFEHDMPELGCLPGQVEVISPLVEENLDARNEDSNASTMATVSIVLEDLLGKASGGIAAALPCKELFALRLVSRAALKDTNQQIEKRLKSMWFEAVSPKKQHSPSPTASPIPSPQEDGHGDAGGRSQSRESSSTFEADTAEAECKSEVSPQKSTPHDVPIFLNIYDVTHYAGVQVLNAVFANQYSPVKFGGIFHIGVQIGQKEWSYGYKAEGTGVFWTPPMFQAAHHFRESVSMGKTELSKRRIESVITELEAEWTGPSYNVFRRNCCHFADALCQRLDIGRVPEWTCRLANIGSTAAEAFQALETPGLMPLSLCSKAPGAIAALPATPLPELPDAPSGVDV